MRITRLKTAIFGIFLILPFIGNAQFHTIRKKTGVETLKVRTAKLDSIKVDNKDVAILQPNFIDVDSILDSMIPKEKIEPDFNAEILPNDIVRKKHLGIERARNNLPLLTINNLIKEIRLNGIQHEEIVLAQAILETGWFTSSVCRNKHNLFGLTNPRTGQYYEFNHWTESVRAYYTKVQYRYKGGNYLLWLDKIGYAEDPRYVSSLIRILKQYIL